jgi:hypothetical protein
MQIVCIFTVSLKSSSFIDVYGCHRISKDFKATFQNQNIRSTILSNLGIFVSKMSSLFSLKVLTSFGRNYVQRNVKLFSSFVKDDNSSMKYWENDYNQKKEMTNKQVKI